MFVFLDLEETLVDDWNSGLFMPRHMDCVKEFLANRPGARVGLMSWAVWDERDKERFRKEFQPDLERNLNCTFELVWSMDDWAEELFKHSKKRLSRDDLFDMFGKHEVLFMLCRTHPLFRGEDVFLVDDAVEHNLSVKSVANLSLLTFLNVNALLQES